MQKYLIYNARIINQEQDYIGSLIIKDKKIYKIIKGEPSKDLLNNYKKIDATGKILFPGIIDTHVHFREPGLEHKADIYTESKAAVAGGITSFMEMPNTIPQATSIELLEEKNKLAAEKSLANYSFYLGATNSNLEEIRKIDPSQICGLKLFLGSSTGNMLVDNQEFLNTIFQIAQVPIVIHSEDEKIINDNLKIHKEKFGDDIPIKYHNKIRTEEACFKSTDFAVKLAKKHNTQIHIAHITTAKELQFLQNNIPLTEKKITAEVCPQHLWFNEKDYEKYGTKIKCNPAIKTEKDKISLLNGLLSDKIDIISTDHAPHLLSEKNNNYVKAPSGIPIIQFSLPIMLEFYYQKKLSLNKIVEKMCHSPAQLFKIHKRGFIKENYFADFVLLDIENKWRLIKENIFSKCKWSPFENYEFQSKITHTFVNGNLVFENNQFFEKQKGERLLFKRL